MVRLAAKRRLSLLSVLVSSLVVAGLWGGNIGTLYPMVEIVFKGNSIPQHITADVEQTRQEIIDLKAALQNDDDPLIAQSIKLKQKRLAYAEWFLPYANDYLPTTPFATLILVVGLLLGGTTIKLIALGINMMVVKNVAEQTGLDIRDAFFRKALRLDLDRFGENGSADLTARLTNDTGAIVAGVNTLLGRVVREPLKMIVCVFGAMAICPRLLLLVMVVVPLMAVIMNSLSRSIRRASRRAMEEMSELYGMLTDAFAGIRVVKAFNTQSKERAKFRGGIQAFYGKSMKIALYNMLARSTSEWMGMAIVSLAILGGGYLVLNQETHLLGMRMTQEPLNVGQMLLFFGLLIGASDPARKLADVWSNLQGGIAASIRVYEILDADVRVTEPRNPLSLARPHQAIVFEDLHFAYPSGPSVLRGIDMSIRHGETVAVVGPNGCGKSTLVSLMCRFDDPQQGDIRLDDVPLARMRTRDLRQRLALVTQRTVLFDDTIENNIRYGSPGADSHDVVRAAKLAHADEFIRGKTPDGYKTRLGVSGVRLSGGQMQRLALARAFLRNPDILILDEATSAIDLESERLIHHALGKYLVDRTGIMITHRPTSLALADRIIVIQAGQIDDSGTHAELLERNRFYQSLCGTDMPHRRAA
ncbi:MAG: ABC transporter ATP-binding protein [Planctomycetota bacterium]